MRLFFSEKNFFYFLLILTPATGQLLAQDSTLYRLTTGDLNAGADIRSLARPDSQSNQSYRTTVSALSLRYQSSVVFQNFSKRPGKKFKAGDLLSAEIAFGYMQSKDPAQRYPFWFSYRFEMGASFIYKANKNADLNVNLILLRFARDYVTQNISGSGIDLRIRIRRFIAEAGLHSRQLRIIGFSAPYFNNREEANIISSGIRYVLNRDTNAGIRIELLPDTKSNNQDGIAGFRLFYGRYF